MLALYLAEILILPRITGSLYHLFCKAVIVRLASVGSLSEDFMFFLLAKKTPLNLEGHLKYTGHWGLLDLGSCN